MTAIKVLILSQIMMFCAFYARMEALTDQVDDLEHSLAEVKTHTFDWTVNECLCKDKPGYLIQGGTK